jgi:putative ABC transport system substrate-binding protein
MAIKTVIALLVGLALATLDFADAQQAKKVPRIGYLAFRGSASPGEKAFLQGLQGLGYVEGKTIVIEWRSTIKPELLADLAAELVRLKVDVLVAAPTPAVQAAKNATSTIPIVMAFAADPVRTGFVASLARMPELAGKRLDLLRELFPKLSRLAFLAYGGDPAHGLFVKEAQDAAQSFGMQFQSLVIASPDEIEGAFSAMVRERAGALVVQPLFVGSLGQGRRIADLAVQNRLPTVSDLGTFADAGGLISYGPDVVALYRRAATYVDKILKGTKPADLPIEQPTKFEFVINLKTAKQIGLTIPQSVLFRADRVIKESAGIKPAWSSG